MELRPVPQASRRLRLGVKHLQRRSTRKCPAVAAGRHRYRKFSSQCPPFMNVSSFVSARSTCFVRNILPAPGPVPTDTFHAAIGCEFSGREILPQSGYAQHTPALIDNLLSVLLRSRVKDFHVVNSFGF